MPLSADRVLERLVKLSDRLPEAVCERGPQHATFRIGKKTFAYFLNDHHGDGIVAMAARAAPGENTAMIASDPERFYLPAYVGPRGWVALRLDRPRVDWDEVAEVMTDSYLLAAPKRLAKLVEVPPSD